MFALTANLYGGSYRAYSRLGFRDMAVISDYRAGEDRVYLFGRKTDYVLSAYRGDILISLDRDMNRRFTPGDDPIAQIDDSFTLNQAVFL